MNKVKIEFDAIPQNEAFARMAISGFIMYLDPTINDMADIKTAVSEAVTNSIIHGYDNKGGKIFLNAEVEEKKLRIEITDNGSGIDNIDKARKPLYTTKPHEERSGLGFTVMEAFMDSLEVESSPGKGTRVTMKKKIGRTMNKFEQ